MDFSFALCWDLPGLKHGWNLEKLNCFTTSVDDVLSIGGDR